MENRNGLLVDACRTRANGHAERIAALHMIEPRANRAQAITVGADKAYEISAEPIAMNDCQCRDCQSTSGTGHGSYI